MNTLDRSTEEIDDALLGRIAAVEFPPRVEDLRVMLQSQGITEQRSQAITELFAAVQKKYSLGHGYYATLRSDESVRSHYLSQIRPVLQKHFQHRKSDLEELDLLANELLTD